MSQVLASSGEVRQLPPTVNLFCEESEGLQDCQGSTIYEQSKRGYAANKNKIAVYNEVLPYTEYVQPLGNVSKRCFFSNCMLKEIY